MSSIFDSMSYGIAVIRILHQRMDAARHLISDPAKSAGRQSLITALRAIGKDREGNTSSAWLRVGLRTIARHFFAMVASLPISPAASVWQPCLEPSKFNRGLFVAGIAPPSLASVDNQPSRLD